MATTKRLGEGWKLTCGIWSPILLTAPTDVVSALRAGGILPGMPAGFDVLRELWVKAKPWTYALSFSYEGEDERCGIRFECLLGTGEVRLNGQVLAHFSTGELTVDITGCVQPEANLLEVAFEPSAADGNDLFGLCGPVWLRTTNFAELRRVRVQAKNGEIAIQSELTAHTAGRYLFKYLISMNDEAVLNVERYERLRASDARVEHTIKLPAPVSWDGKRYYTVHFSLERSGVGCDFVRINAAMDAKIPTRVMAVPRRQAKEIAVLRAIREAGAEAVVLLPPMSCEELVETDFLADGLLNLSEAALPDDPDFLALPPVAEMEKLSGGERFWPGDAPVWRSLGGASPDTEKCEALYGVNALGDLARYVNISRFVQAEAICAAAFRARRGRQALCVSIVNEGPVFASDALMDNFGRKRPAYAAIYQAWRTCAVFGIEMPFQGKTPLPVWILSDEADRSPVSVTASVYTLDGTLVASTSFAGFSGENSLLGALSAALPEGIVIGRVEMKHGENIRKTDQIIISAPQGQPSRAALMGIEKTLLSLRAGELENTGKAAALGVSFGLFYGAILPGEKIKIPAGIGPGDIELMNGQIV